MNWREILDGFNSEVQATTFITRGWTALFVIGFFLAGLLTSPFLAVTGLFILFLLSGGRVEVK